MKKIVVTLFFMLFGFVKIVSAQITIAGQNFSMLVVLPLILMIVFMLIFGIIIAVDRYKEKKEKEVKEEKKDLKFDIIERIKEKIEKKEEKKEPEKEEAIEYRPLVGYLDEISTLKKNLGKLSTDDAFKQLGAIIKDFFSDYLGIDYEITFDELEKELREKSKEVVFFSKNLSEMSYDADKISRKKVMMLLAEFEDVAKKIILTEEGEAEKLEEKEIFEKKEKPKRVEIKEQKKVEELKKSQYLNEEKKNRIIKLVKEGRMYIKRDISKANDIYEEVYVLYHQLPNDKKKELHKKIMDFYDAIRLELKS